MMIMESHHGTEYILHSSLYILEKYFTLGQFEDTICHPNNTRCSDCVGRQHNSVVCDNDESMEDLSCLCLVSDYNSSCSTELLDTDQWNEVSF